jgi:hypothetical protein
MTPEECKKYAIGILRKTLDSSQWASLAVLVGDDYPVKGRAKTGFLRRLSNLKIERSKK